VERNIKYYFCYRFYPILNLTYFFKLDSFQRMESLIKLAPDKKRRAAIYIRVSTAEQKIDGYGLEAQEKKLLEYIENNKGLNLYTKKAWIFSDTHTGSDLNRPQFQEMMQQVREGKFDAVLVWKIDRLSRSLKHLLSAFELFEKNKVSFVSVQENIDFKGPIGKLIFQIFGAIAQFERELIKGRTQMGKIASAEMGNYTGNFVPYGYRKIKNSSGKGSKLEIIPKEKEWVQQIFDWYIYDKLGFGQISKKLNNLKVPRGEGSISKYKIGKWTEKIIQLLLQSPIYRGEYVANNTDENGDKLPPDQWTIVKVPACVSELTFMQAQNARKSRTGGRTNSTYLLSGRIFDMTLDQPKKFFGAKRFKGGFSYRRKQFNTKEGEHFSVFEVPGEQIENYVWGKIMEAMKNPEVFIKHYLSKEFRRTEKVELLEQSLNSLREREVNIRNLEIPRIQEAYEKGIYDEEILQKKLTEKEEELAKIEVKIQEIEDELGFTSSLDMEVQKLKEASAQIKYKLENLSREQKKILCDLFIDRIEMYRQKEGKRWKVRVETFFRFNPNKFPSVIAEGRTAKTDNEASNEMKKAKSGVSGATR